MARFSRVLLGGAIGAGLAFLLSRKEVRRRLMGKGQQQLPAAYEPEPGTAAKITTPAGGLDSQLEESRRRIETSLEEPFTAAVATGEQVDAAATEASTHEQAIETSTEDEATAEEEAIKLEAELTITEESVAAEEAATEESPADKEEPVEGTRSDETPLSARTVPVEYDSPAFDPFATEPAPAESETVETTEETAPVEPEPVEEAAQAEPAPVEPEPVEEAAQAEPAPVEPEPVEEAVQAEPEPVEPEPVEEAAQADSDESGFSELGTPVEGEPGFEETETIATTVDVVEEPAGPEPSGIDRDEMKRRIDETRARLKAKAFDAMVSGETFVTPETGEPMKADEPGVEIDEETGEQIDRSLKEQD